MYFKDIDSIKGRIYTPTKVTHPSVLQLNESERWYEIIIDNIREGYFISSNGIIYDNIKKKYIPFSKTLDGYLFVKLKTKDDNIKFERINRLVLMTICPVLNMYDLEVNHINGIKTNNVLSNLEYVTRGQNIHHSYLLGSRSSKGESNANSRLNEEQVERICKLRMKGLKSKDICAELNLEYNGTNRTLINRILQGKTWTHVSNKYILPQTQRGNCKFTREQISIIRKLWKIGIPEEQIRSFISNSKFTPNMKQIKDIIENKSWKNIE